MTAGTLIPDPDYPEPLPLLPDMEASAPYPLEALGELLGGAAAAIVEACQVPGALAAQSVLAAAAMAAQPHGNALRDGQLIPLSLFGLTVAESGDRKSAADRLALRAHHERQSTLLDVYDTEQKQYRNRRDAYQCARSAILEGAKADSEAVADELGKLKEPTAPPVPFILVEEPTLEGLQKSLLRGHPSQGLFSDEGGQFFGGHASRPENMLKSVAGLSKLWDGAPIIRTRAAEGESASRSGCRLSAHLMIQPIVASEVLSNPLMQGQGFLARFLIAWPQSLAGTRFYKPTNPSCDLRLTGYWMRMKQLLTLAPPKNERGDLEPNALVMDSDGKAVWIKAHDAIEMSLGRDGSLQEIKPTAAKGGENILRIAGVLAIVEKSETLSQQIIERAVTLVNWYLGEAFRLTNPVSADPQLLKAQRLLEWLIENDWHAFDARTLQQKGPPVARKSAKQRDALLAVLVKHHQLLMEGSKRFRVNPTATTATGQQS
ncbi:YfjI family protein [Pseudomonas sp. 148P]|uniref:YfjI family protein n=1 Tax=Pseudomonas ulcerans TaxID=3115852 RepID=A0ABU7HL51_9PSED|nr:MULTISPECIES: YfjI family protein [unclassified Pseudomonas]MEE1920847.1 YfjI family protein [Pseudomonas sp. 147P]MEE1932252.1 YfjI family protein [Pseudomonas sp. 148P]